ncbi:MAG: hypothetical protein J7L54_01195 [Elusimicrobia bacterium]|nr:hypothetical protein [Elusimicrobiota bacterium]
MLFVVFLCFLNIFSFLFIGGKIGAAGGVFVDVLIITICTAIALKLAGKIKKISNQLQVASTGSFTTDFPEKIKDELDFIQMKLSNLFKNLKEYDSIRAKDVTKSAKALDRVITNITQPIIKIDTEEKTATLNPPAQEIWNVETKEFPLDIVMKHAQNVEFSKFLKKALEGAKDSAKTEIYFPSASKKEVEIKALPVKTIEGKIPLVFLFINQ